MSLASFGALLRRHRAAAGISQEELAERAGLSRRGIADLERGARRLPYAETIQRLVDALELEPNARAELFAAVRAARSAQPERTDLATTTTITTTPVVTRPPEPLSSFVGREDQIAELCDRLRSSRLVSLVGAGGIGKTRLALEVARRLADRGENVVWVDLASISSPEHVAAKVAASLGVRERPGVAVTETLVESIGTQPLLFLVDNGEHVLRACADTVNALLQRCRNVRVLATSREPLHIVGEVVWRVPTLSVPGSEARSAHAMLETEACRLFVQRAQTADRTFSVGEVDASLVGALCRRLDGLPLALELAGARAPVLGLRPLNTRLERHFDILSAPGDTVDARQRTIRATLDWSYELLSQDERKLLAWLAVFVDGWTLDACEAVCGGDYFKPDQVVDLLSRLVDRSLVVVQHTLSDPRYRLLEPIRQYALEKLTESGEHREVRRRHADYYAALAEEIGYARERPATRSAIDELELEHANLLAALLALSDRPAKALHMGFRLLRLWGNRGYMQEGQRELRRMLCLPGAEVHTAARVEALFAAGILLRYAGDLQLARSVHEEGSMLADQLGLGSESAFHLTWRSHVALGQGDHKSARALAESALQKFEELGDKKGEVSALGAMRAVLRADGDTAAAHDLAARKLALSRELGDEWEIAWALVNLGNAALERGEPNNALAHFNESLRVVRDLETPSIIASALEGLSSIAATEGRPRRAVRLIAAAAALRERSGMLVVQQDAPAYQLLVGSARVRAGEHAKAAWLEGSALTLHDAIEYALQSETDEVAQPTGN